MYGGEGDDYMIGGHNNSSDGGDDTLDGDFMRGGPGDDYISDGDAELAVAYGSPGRHSYLYGDGGNDKIWG